MPRLRFVSTVQGASTIELNEPIITIGRVANNVVCIEDPNISKHHTLLVSEEDTYKIYDLHSVNGTWVNSERVTVTKLKDGDAVRIGYLELKYEIGAVAATRPASVVPAAAKTIIGPATLAPRLKLGLKPAGTSPTPPDVVPPTASPANPPVAPPPVPNPVNEEKRAVIQVPPVKKSTGPTAAPVVPAAAAPESTAPAPTPAAPAGGPKKLGGAPGGGPAKFKLKRE